MRETLKKAIEEEGIKILAFADKPTQAVLNYSKLQDMTSVIPEMIYRDKEREIVFPNGSIIEVRSCKELIKKSQYEIVWIQEDQ